MAVDWTKPVQTRLGLPIRVLCTDQKVDDYPVVGLVTRENGRENLETWDYDGNFIWGGETIDPDDAINVPDKPKQRQPVDWKQPIQTVGGFRAWLLSDKWMVDEVAHRLVGFETAVNNNHKSVVVDYFGVELDESAVCEPVIINVPPIQKPLGEYIKGYMNVYAQDNGKHSTGAVHPTRAEADRDAAANRVACVDLSKMFIRENQYDA